jgi:hypothetical protein
MLAMFLCSARKTKATEKFNSQANQRDSLQNHRIYKNIVRNINDSIGSTKGSLVPIYPNTCSDYQMRSFSALLSFVFFHFLIFTSPHAHQARFPQSWVIYIIKLAVIF